MSVKVKVQMQPVSTILTRLGVDKNGDVQKFVTHTINRRITRYMPFRTSVLSTKLKHVKSSTEIEVLGPYAAYQYHGKVMVDPKINAAGFMTPEGWRSRKNSIKVLTDRDLEYDKTKNPRAGPYWDRRMMAAEGKQIAAETEAYVRRKR